MDLVKRRSYMPDVSNRHFHNGCGSNGDVSREEPVIKTIISMYSDIHRKVLMLILYYDLIRTEKGSPWINESGIEYLSLKIENFI